MIDQPRTGRTFVLIMVRPVDEIVLGVITLGPLVRGLWLGQIGGDVGFFAGLDCCRRTSKSLMRKESVGVRFTISIGT